ncbi:MAG TPA: transporter [Acidobacteriota bacterium]|nr:transporter [Acidobacteriota bacterium]
MNSILPQSFYRRLFMAGWLVLGLSRAAAQLTDVPLTVAPGRFLLEADVVSFAFDREEGEKYSAFAVGSVLVTTGLTERLDLQAGVDMFVSEKYESAAGFSDRHSGVGHFYLRTKWRFYETETSSAAVIPYAKIPNKGASVGNRSVEGGVIVPFETKLPGALLFNTQMGVELLRNANDDGYDTNWSGTAVLTRDLTRRISLYGEAILNRSTGGGGTIGTIGAGLYFTVSESLAWDLAVYRGISRAATDWNPVVRCNLSF